MFTPWLAIWLACSEPTFYPDPLVGESGLADADADADADTDADTDTDTLPCSTFGGQAVTLTVTNGTSAAGDLVWRDQNCNEFLYATLQPAQTYVQPTFGFHVWVFRAPGGAEVDHLQLDDGVDTVWVIE